MKGRKWLKRALAVALVTAICFTQATFGNLAGSTEVKAATETLITDGGFEDSTNYEVNWHPEVASYDSYSTMWQKDGYLNVYNGLSIINAMSIYQTVNLQEGVYRLSIDVKGGTGSSGLYLKASAGEVDLMDALAVDATSESEYTTLQTGCFELKESTDVTISLGGNVSSRYWANIDNIVLTKMSVNSTDTIVDGGFENDTNFNNNWSPSVASWDSGDKNSTIWSKDGYLNVWNATSTTNEMSIYQDVTLSPGDYKVSVNAKGKDSDSGLRIMVQEQNQDEVNVLIEPVAIVTSGSDDYATVDTPYFTINEEKTVRIFIGGDVPSEYWANLDDVVLYKASEKEPADLSQLTKLLESVPSNYETAGFTSSSVAALETAITNANACTVDSDAATIESCYTALDTALKSLVYQDSKIYVKKVDGMRDDFIKGIDISSYISEVNSGVVYRNWDGQAVAGKEFIKLFAAEGVNYIRLRVWNDPKTTSGTYYGGGNNDLARTVEICNIINEYNTTPGYGDTYGKIKVLVDIQYSDFWADPDKQAAPKAWQGMTIDQKTAAVSEFTNTVLTQVAETGVEIGMVQIGNETNTGICGERIPEYSTEGSTQAAKDALADTGYIRIFNAGCEAVDTYNRANSTNIKKVVHFTDPHNADTYFAQMLLDGGVNYDVYATSYYPFWHGTTSNLNTMLTKISKLQNDESGKNIEVMVAETQYVYTNEDYDGADNQAYEGKNNIDLSGWPVSVQGQANELRDVIAAVADVGERGIGAFYWEPGWLGVGNAYDENGELSETALAANKNKWETYGSGWATDAAAEYDTSAAEWGGGGTNNENASLFDFTGHPQSSLHVFKYVNYGAVATQKSYYNYEYGADQGSITISAGLTASEIQKKLEDGIKGVYILYNDGSKGDTVVPIAWSASSLSELEKKIATNSAIGNAYLVKGIVTVDGEAHDVQATVNVEPAKNLLKNGNFESMDGWTAEPASIVFQDSDNPRNGADNNRKCIAFKTYGPNVTGLTADGNGCYLATVSQNVTITEPGVYEAKAFFEGASGTGERTGEKINVTVAYGDTTLTSNAVVLSGWMNWQCATVSEITVTQKMIDEGNNTLTVSANLLLCKDTWGSLDDFYLYKIADVTETPETPADSETPVTPTEPTLPSETPTEPTKPTESIVPTTPTKPTTPVETEIPTKPTTPVVPPASGVTSVTASSQAGAPSVSIETDSSKLASMLCTEAEQKKIAEGTPLYVSMTVANITATVSQKEKELVTTAAKGYNIGEYLDITLFKQLGNDPKSKVTEVNGKLQVAVTVPTALLNTDASVNRTYKMVRIHNDEATLLDSSFNKATGVLTFETDRFSTYAIVYTDSDVPVTGDATPIAAWAWILVISAALLIAAFGIYRRRQRR